MEGMVKKYHIALFVNGGTHEAPAWTRIRKSTSLELNMNPETQDYDYITDQSPTTEILRYKPSLSQPVTMYKGEPDYSFAFGKFFNLQTGEKAKCEVLIVFMQEDSSRIVEGVSTVVYKAWRNNATLSISSLNGVDSTITMDISFGGKIDHGFAYPDSAAHAPVFILEESGEAGWVDPFSEGGPLPAPAVPAFSDTWKVSQDVPVGGSVTLDGSASVPDGGTLSYQWTVNGAVQGETGTSFTVDTSTEGRYVVTVIAANALNGHTAVAVQTAVVTVS